MQREVCVQGGRLRRSRLSLAASGHCRRLAGPAAGNVGNVGVWPCFNQFGDCRMISPVSCEGRAHRPARRQKVKIHPRGVFKNGESSCLYAAGCCDVQYGEDDREIVCVIGWMGRFSTRCTIYGAQERWSDCLLTLLRYSSHVGRHSSPRNNQDPQVHHQPPPRPPSIRR